MTHLTQLFVEIVRVETGLWNVLDARLRAVHVITVGQLHLLRAIAATPGCRVHDLAAESGLTVGATSKAVDRLEAAGWCVRRPNPDDRRSSLLALTPDGDRLRASAEQTLAAELTGLLGAALTDDTAQRMIDDLRRIDAAVAAATTE